MSISRAAKILEQLGEAAFKPYQVNGIWRKARLSARQAAKLRKEHLVAGKEWPFESVWPGIKKNNKPPRQPKGHKWEAEKLERQKRIEEQMKQMPKRVAEYRESKKIKDVSLLDMLTLLPSQIRFKYMGKKI
ncbi:hypothetical protein BSKO_00410 [Bryopsis sp. KO-2023]|nr:hypothetical protein BSKO_00410 [Bryopsis sp. KO-2023]